MRQPDTLQADQVHLTAEGQRRLAMQLAGEVGTNVGRAQKSPEDARGCALSAQAALAGW
jgi:hypothetical protein